MRWFYLALVLISIFIITYDLNSNELNEVSDKPELVLLQFSPQDVEINASRVDGVAPLAVFFDGIGNLEWNEIESSDFDWNFGDGKTFSGYMASNIFENPGNYTVNLTVSVNGSVVASRSLSINVTSMIGRTICVSSTSNFTGCPSSNLIDHFNDLAMAWGNITTNTTMLLRKGDTFIQSSGLISNVAGPVYVGAYGIGEKPVIRTVSLLTSFYTTGDDWRFRDFRFIGVRTINTGGEPFSDQGSHKLMQNIEIINASSSGIGAYGANNHDTFIHDVYIETPGRYCSYSASGYRFSFFNVTCIRPGGSDQGSALRSYVNEKVLVYGGYAFEDLDSTSANYRIYPNRYVLFSNVTSDTISYRHLAFANSQGGSEGEIYNNIIVERNLFKNGANAVGSQARNITVRNNIGFNNVLFSHYHTATAMNVRVYGNTAYQNDSTYGLFGEIYTPVVSSFVKNNVFYSPCNSQQGDCNFLRNNNANGAELSNNIAYLPNRSVNCINSSGTMGSSSCTDPLFVNLSLRNFAPLNNSPLIDNGIIISGLFEDYFGYSRLQGSSSDIGAIEYFNESIIILDPPSTGGNTTGTTAGGTTGETTTTTGSSSTGGSSGGSSGGSGGSGGSSGGSSGSSSSVTVGGSTGGTGINENPLSGTETSSEDQETLDESSNSYELRGVFWIVLVLLILGIAIVGIIIAGYIHKRKRFQEYTKGLNRN